jgi:dolichol-phosphate mannosyltransferase
MSQLDIVIPVYNEGEGIRATLKSLSAHVTTPHRILMCYDQDDDTTLPMIQSTGALGNIILVKNPQQGAHAAVCAGLRESTAKAVLVFPADDAYNASMIDTMYAAYQQGADIVVANRFIRGGCMEGCPWLKALLVRTSAWMLRHLARLPSADASNGFRLFSRRVLAEIPIESSMGFTYSIELLVKCHRLGWRIDNVPVRWFQRRTGTSRFRVLQWLPSYLRWFAYAFATTYLRRGPGTVRRLSATECHNEPSGLRGVST